MEDRAAVTATADRRAPAGDEGKLNVLILGSGAREHALAWACAKSPSLGHLFVAPGNPGCATVAQTIPLSLADRRQIGKFCVDQAIDLVVVGPEAPLVAGITDYLTNLGITCCGPSREAARLEGSKGFAKDFCREFGIPTGEYLRFRDPGAAKAYIRDRGAPIVVKADGLASGKGVIVARTVNEATAAVDSMFSQSEWSHGGVVVEEVLEGEEVSFFALCDGVSAIPFGSAQDHKRLGEGDTGPNTGGMGAYSPPRNMTAELTERVMREIVTPTVRGMTDRGSPFRGVLFAGLMIGEKGPKLIEYNVRFGDPEAAAILPRLEGDLLQLLGSCASGRLGDARPTFRPEAALTVVMAARGYPSEPLRGTSIRGLEDAGGIPGVTVFQAGTRRVGETIVADGGRVLAITALGRDLRQARERAYTAVDRIDWSDGFCRRDIGWRAFQHEHGSGQ
jgi:phosphoribosylamine--glycine ligase